MLVEILDFVDLFFLVELIENEMIYKVLGKVIVLNLFEMFI